jgi:hypothetical protein
MVTTPYYGSKRKIKNKYELSNKIILSTLG